MEGRWYSSITMTILLLLVFGASVSANVWQDCEVRIMDVRHIMEQAWEAAEEELDRSQRYSIFVDAEMRQLSTTGDWQGAGYDSLSDAVYEYSYRLAKHMLLQPGRQTVDNAMETLRRTQLGAVLGSPSFSVEFTVNNEHPEATDEGPGTPELPFKTISRAAELAWPGDTVTVHTGTYRELVAPRRSGLPESPIVYQAAPGAEVIISAADIWQPEWVHVQGQVYKAPLDPALFEGYNPFAIELVQGVPQENFYVTSIPCYDVKAEIVLTLGQLIVGGQLYQEVSSKSDSINNFEAVWTYMPEEEHIYVHFPADTKPGEEIVEISARRQCFAPDESGLGHITVRGFTMKYAANQNPVLFWRVTANMQAGALSTSRGHHWLIEDNTIVFSKSIGLDFANQTQEGALARDQVGYHVIRNNVISDNGIIGIMGWGSRGVLIEDNLISGNNHLKMWSYEMGGLKTHAFDGIIRGNKIINNYGHGLWLDNNYQGAVVSGNLFYNNWDAGIFLEMCDGPALLDNNVIIASRKGLHLPGHGVYAHDAGGFTLSNNLIFASDGLGLMVRTIPGDRQIPSKEILVLNNVFFENRMESISLPFDGEYAWDNFSDYNVFDATAQLVLSTWGVVTRDRRLAQVEAMRQLISEVQPEQTATAWRGVATWASPEGLVLDLPLWQQVQKWDQNSSEGVVSDVSFSFESMELRLTVDSLDRWRGQFQAGVEKDYLGVEVTKPVLIGPFQDLKEGDNVFQL